MQQSNKEVELKYNAVDLYNIVLDIERYPEYIPWCTKIEIINKNKNLITANMMVNYKFFPTQQFTSRVEFNEKDKTIQTSYIKGPLKDLHTTWHFNKISNNKTKIFFIVKFEFKNFFHQKLAELFFPLIESKMIESFIRRAENKLK